MTTKLTTVFFVLLGLVTGCDRNDPICGSPTHLCAGQCSNPKSDHDNCGACGNACAADQVCNAGQCDTGCSAGTTECSGACVDLTSDGSHCGTCATACTSSNGTASCVAGVCATASCSSGYYLDQDSCVACSGACAEGQYQSAACGGTSDRTCAACTAIPNCTAESCTTSGDQVCTACSAGTTECSGACVDLSSDGSHCGTCVNACTSSNGTASCVAGVCTTASCSSGYYLDHDQMCGTCSPGTFLSNGACVACSAACPAGQYQSGACSATADRTCAACTPITGCSMETCTTPTDQVCGGCSVGFYFNGSSCVSCSGSCPSGLYQSATCSATADRVCSTCTAIAGCAVETCTTSSNQVCSSCSAGEYNNGTSCVACSGACAAGQYQSAACSATSDRTCASCTAIAGCTAESCTTASNQICSACAAGEYLNGNSCVACSGACAAGQYQSAACSATSDRTCSSCTTIGGCTAETCTTASDQVCSACGTGEYLSGNSCVACSGACAAGQYQSAACSATSDRTCSSCTAITGCTTESCTTASDQVCTACGAGEYPSGNSCVACSGACPSGQYQSAACSSTSDRVCSSCTTIASCTAESCTTAGDQTCSSCGSGTYLNGGQCSTCSTCGTGQFVSTACTAASNTVCATTDCYALHAGQPSTPSGLYLLDPDGAGGADPFEAYCDMTSTGGGWTLLMKVDGTQTTFSYDSAYWTNNVTYQPTDDAFDHVNETKLAGFASMPLNALRFGMYASSSGTTSWLETPRVNNSLLELFSGGYTPTSLGRAAWESLLPAPSLQPNCNQEGFNTTIGNGVEARIGIITNQENDCLSPDSRLGIGTAGSSCSENDSNSCGDEPGNCSPENANPPTESFGYVMVRDCPGGVCDCGALSSCNAVCVDATTDLENCGSCNNVCGAQHANPSCAGGSCVENCQPGYVDCDNNPNNGCEANFNSDNNNCGGCGNVCPSNKVCGGGNCVDGLTIINPNGAHVEYLPRNEGNDFGAAEGSCDGTCSVNPTFGSGGFGRYPGSSVRIRSSSGFASGCDATSFEGQCYIFSIPKVITVN